MSQTDPNRQEPAPSQLDAEVERELAEALGDKSVEQIMDEANAPAPAAVPAEGGDDAEPRRFEMEIKRGRITGIRGDDVFVELAGLEAKMQGVVPLTQFERPPRLGSIMDFVVERVNEAEGLVHLNREGAVTRTTWDNLQKGSIVEARVTGTNKGGLELEMVGSIRAFMPASQIDMHHVTSMEEYVGQKLTASVQQIDRKGRKVTLSRRVFLEHERATKREKTLAELEPGQTRDGVVTSVTDYGAFVDIGGMDGLVHISDLSYKHITKPDQVVKVGQAVKVKVLKIDKEKQRISLGLKQVEPDPWEGLAGRLRVGEQISGRIVRIAEFGAFIEVETGIEGLLPVSEISWKRNVRAGDLLKEGEIVRVLVLQVDAEKRRISLSLKQSSGDPWVGATVKWAKHSLLEATVQSITDFGAFVEIEAGVEGLVHISELSEKRVNTVGDVLKVGDKHQFRVLEVDEDNRRIRLSLKAVKEAPPVEKPADPAAAAAAAKAAAKTAPRKTPKPGVGGLGKSGALGMGLRDLKL